jgi:hypothetical protein
MKLRQPREAMPLTVWIAFALMAIGTVVYLTGFVIIEDILAYFSARKMSWSRSFDDPIPTSKGKPLVNLRDAAAYIMALPEKEADTAEWQAAIEGLMLVAELDGPTTFARIGIMRALNRHVERVLNPDRKDHHWERRKLARDR